jgi:hypothetical protein
MEAWSHGGEQLMEEVDLQIKPRKLNLGGYDRVE